MKKRILAMLLAITMIISMVPVQVFATETEPVEVVEQITETTEAVTEAPEETTLPEESEEETTVPETTEESQEETTVPAETEASQEEPAVFSVRRAVETVASEAADPAKVTVTIGARGVLELVRKEVTVRDLDSDGLLTFDEAMVATHTAYYKDGAEGYVSLLGAYGLQVGKLWGYGNGDFLNGMFFTNNVTNAMNVGESYVAQGDDLYATALYNDKDINDWYTYFDQTEVSVNAGEEFTLTLKGFPGMTWGDPVSYAVPGVTVGTWDDDFTALSGKTTNANGQVTLSFAEAGTYVVSASGMVYDETDCPIIAPACVVTVNEAVQEPEVIGSVRVIVENTTFTTAASPWSGTLVDTEVPLLDNMTMMTAILTALNNAGHTWEGTGADDPNGWDISYISAIYKNGTEELAEFHGGRDSGWMGVLNDWFVNKGFEQWKAGEDLLDGDVIRVMYTLNKGGDIGGGFGTNKGFLSSLSPSTGTLDPAFDKEVLDYTLIVDKDVTSLDLTAAAENKEDKVTITAGGKEYRLGKNIPVADGTEITVTCGAKTYTVEVEVKEPAPAWPFTISVNGEALEVTDLGTTEECTKMYYTAKKMEVTVPAGTKTVTVNGVAGAVYLYPNHGSQKIASPGSNTEVAVSENAYLCMRDVMEGGWYHVAVKFAPCEHNWVDATCKAPKTCSVCGATEGEANPDAHNYVNGTCEHCGEAEPAKEYVIDTTDGGKYTKPNNVTYVDKITIGNTVSVKEVTANGTDINVVLAEGTDPAATFAVDFSYYHGMPMLSSMYTLSFSGDVDAEGKGVVTLEDGAALMAVIATGTAPNATSTSVWTVNFTTAGSDVKSKNLIDVNCVREFTDVTGELVSVGLKQLVFQGCKVTDYQWVNETTLNVQVSGNDENITLMYATVADTFTSVDIPSPYTVELKNGKATVNYAVCAKAPYSGGEHYIVVNITGENAVPDVPAEPATPFSQKITLPANGDDFWGYLNGLTLSGTDGSIYEAYWSSKSNPFVLDVILGQDTDLNAEITAAFTGAGIYAPTITGDTTVALVDGKGTLNITAKSYNTALYGNTQWTINLIVDDGSAANRPTYAVTLPTETVGYTVTAYDSESPVIGGRSFSFKIAIDSKYTKTDDFKVLVNGEEITSTSDTYTLTNINEPINVTVEGIREKTLAELNVTIIAPEGSTISTGKFYSYFKYDFDEPLEVTTLEDGRIQYVAPVPGSQQFMRIQHPDGVTYWDFDNMSAGSRFEITEEMLFIGSNAFTKDTVYHNFEKNIKDKADLYLTVNEKGWLDMNSGDTWNLNVFRNFLSLGNSVTNNCVALPDTHYRVIGVNGSPSDVVSVTPDANNSCYAEIKAEKPGTAIILVTYDAVYNNDGEGSTQWSALWPENTGVIVVTVDGPTGDFATNMTINEEANATGKQVIDAEHDILFYAGNQGASYSFKPEAGCTVTVNRSSVGSEMNFRGFTRSGVSTAADGTVTVSGLTTGTHIIKVVKGGKAVYQVVRARQVSYDVTHSNGAAVTDSNPAQPGETITVQFHDLISPMEKLSGVYNTNFAFRYNTAADTVVQSSSSSGYGVYTFSGDESLQKFSVTIPSYWNESAYALTKGSIKLGGFGSSAGAHRTTTYIAGKEVNTNASGVSGYLAMLPEILISTTPCGHESYNVTLPTGEGYTVSGGTVPVPEGETYNFTVTISGGYDGENLAVLVNGESIEGTDGSYTVENVREDLVITVEGVTKYPVVDMTPSKDVYNKAAAEGYWGRENYGWVDTVTFGGAEVVSSTWDGDTCNVVLSYDTAKNGFVGFAFTAAGRSNTYAGRVTATLNGVSMTAGAPTTVKLVDGTATVQIYAQYSSDRYSGTKTFVLTVQETPEEVVSAVDTVTSLIGAIQLPVDLEDEEAIQAAWEAYNALSEKEKTLVANADTLLQAKAELEDLKAVQLVSGKTVTLKTSLTGKVTWSMDKEYKPFASITAAGKVTAKRILEKVSVYAVAKNAEGTKETVRIDIYPAVSQVKILDAEGTLLNGKTIPVKVNDSPDGTYVFSTGSNGAYTFTAGTYPADAMGDVTWTVSDTKGALVTYEVEGNAITLRPAENVKKGTVTLTATSADGSNKKAALKLNIAVLVDKISVTTKDGKNLTKDDDGNTIVTLASGMSVTLTATPNANATSKAVTWSMVEGGEYATVSTSGKLTAAKDLMGVKYAVVRVAAKDGGDAFTDTKVKITPLALGVQMYNSGRVCTDMTQDLNMTAQNTLTLNARVYPLGKADQTVNWTTSNAKVASVSVDEKGYATVTCLKAGKVTITATAADGSKEKATFTLNIVQGVESLTLENQVIAVKKSLNLAKLIKINPTTATNKKLTWEIVGDAHGASLSSSGTLNTSKVDVPADPVAITVRASAQDGCGAAPAICTVTVYPATTKNTMVIKNGEAVVGNKDVLELEAGKTLTLKGFCEGAANVYTWKSNNKNVQVADGVITAAKAAIGKTVIITCTAADGTNVNVTAKVKIVAPAAEK